MHNSSKSEGKLYSFLKEQFSKSNFIKLNYFLIPNGISNKLERFYSNNGSLWFSRLNNKHDSYYYFGVMNDEKLGQNNIIFPRIILRFNNDVNKSSIHIINNNVAILIERPDDDAFSFLKDHFKLVYVDKDNNPNLFYLILGELNSKKMIKNLDLFVRSFEFNINFNAKK